MQTALNTTKGVSTATAALQKCIRTETDTVSSGFFVPAKGRFRRDSWSRSPYGMFYAALAFNNDNNMSALKGANRDFHNLLTAPRTVSNTCAPVARAQSCADHVQHMERLSHATCRVPHGTKGQLSC